MKNKVNNLGKTRLGKLEQRFLSYAQLKGLTTVRYGQLRSVLALDALQEKKVLSRLARAGVIVRLKRGIYLFPPRLPLGGIWNPGEYLVLQELMKACDDGRYQLCGWPVFNRYGFTDQVSTRVYAYNNRLSGDRTIGGQDYTFIKISDKRLGATVMKQTPDGIKIVLPTRERALMDAVYDWSRFASLPIAYAWIRRMLKDNKRSADELALTACRYGNQSAIRRIGYVLENCNLQGKWKMILKNELRESVSLIPLVPGRSARGSINREWGLIVNE